MKRKRIVTYLIKRFNSAKQNQKNIHGASAAESLHEFRLSIKKIKSIRNIMEASSADGDWEMGLIKRVYEEAGVLRTAEIILQTVKSYQISNEALVERQKNIILKTFDSLNKRKKEYAGNIKKLEKQFTGNKGRIRKSQVIIFFKTSLNTLTINFLWPLVTNLLHESRKNMKDLIYIYKMLPLPLRNRVALNVKYLDQLQELIGEWHDVNISSTLMLSTGNWEDPGYLKIREEEKRLLNNIKASVELFDRKVVRDTSQV